MDSLETMELRLHNVESRCDGMQELVLNTKKDIHNDLKLQKKDMQELNNTMCKNELR